MENKPQNVFDRLDSIEASQASTKEQNEKILDLLNKLSFQHVQQQNNGIDLIPKVSTQQLIQNFLVSSKKEHVWFGFNSEFNRDKAIVKILSIALIIAGVLSTVFTSITFKLYSTFTLFENIWLVFACIIFSYSNHAKKRMLDTDLKKHSTSVFIQDADGTWRDTYKEKKRFKWFRRISYIAVLCNIIMIWDQSSGAIAITATVLELIFLGLSIGLYFANINLFMYGSYILYTGRNTSNTETVTLIFDVVTKKLAPYEEYKEKMGDYL